MVILTRHDFAPSRGTALRCREPSEEFGCGSGGREAPQQHTKSKAGNTEETTGKTNCTIPPTGIWKLPTPTPMVDLKHWSWVSFSVLEHAGLAPLGGQTCERFAHLHLEAHDLERTQQKKTLIPQNMSTSLQHLAHISSRHLRSQCFFSVLLSFSLSLSPSLSLHTRNYDMETLHQGIKVERTGSPS
jgi:hypothetical protein